MRGLGPGLPVSYRQLHQRFRTCREHVKAFSRLQKVLGFVACDGSWLHRGFLAGDEMGCIPQITCLPKQARSGPHILFQSRFLKLQASLLLQISTCTSMLAILCNAASHVQRPCYLVHCTTFSSARPGNGATACRSKISTLRWERALASTG